MGAVCAIQPLENASEDKISQEIDKRHKDDYRKISKESRILLIGTGEAGKTTVMKQIQIFHDKGFTEEQKLDFKAIIYKQVIKNVKILIRESAKTDNTATQTFDMERANRINQFEERIADSISFDIQVTPQLWEDLKEIWADKSIQETYNYNYKFILDDSTKYFLDKLDILSSKDYKPDYQDILRLRVKTAAVVDKVFDYKDNPFRIIDVGGQRSERRKWIHCFPDITALIFCIAISEYDQNLREDNITKRLDETFRVFEDVINNKYFKSKPIIVFLNKMDIFEEKLKKRPINQYYPEFQSADTVDKAVECIQKKLKSLDKNSNGGNRITFHSTIAINTDLFIPVFNAVVLHALHDSLCNSGFIKPNKPTQ